MLLLQSVAIIAAFVATTEGLTQPGNSCCQTKSVGSVAYVLADTQDTSNYGCLNNCTYNKQADGLGSQKYCFQTGALPVHCGDQATGGTGGSGGSGGTGGTGETGGGTEAAPIRPDGGTEAAPIRPIGCTVEWGIDYYGNDVGGPSPGRSVKDWAECSNLCAAQNQCLFWTYRKYDSKCWLKTSNSGRNVVTYGISGTKECGGGTEAAPIRPNGCTVEWEFDYYGNDIPGHSSLPVKDWAECSNLCAALNECLFWSYVPSNSVCYLKTSNGGGRVNSDRISGTKECGGLPTVYSQPAGEIELKKNNLLATVDIGRQWEVSFDFMPENYDARDWTIILHLTIGGDWKTLGDRTPAIMWHPNYGLTVATAIGNNTNFWDETKKPSPPVGKWSRIVASQRTLDSTTYMSLEIDGISSFAPVKNPAPQEFSSVKVYASDNWTPTQPASIRGLVIKTK